MKKFLSGVYLIASLIAACGQPSDDKSLAFVTTYYMIVLGNLALAVIIYTKLHKKT